MQLNIGIRDVAQAVTVDVDMTPDEVQDMVAHALENGSLLTFTGENGKSVFVPADALGFVQISNAEQRQVGFGI